MGWDICPDTLWWCSNVESKRKAGETKYGISADKVCEMADNGEDISAYSPVPQWALLDARGVTGYTIEMQFSSGWDDWTSTSKSG